MPPRGLTLPAHRLPHPPGRVATPDPARSRTLAGAAVSLERLNAAPVDQAVRALLACLRARRWAHRLAAYRPYPNLPALLAAADEAAYDLSSCELTEALAAEPLPALPEDICATAYTALSAAYAAYEARFGHAFVICLDGLDTQDALDHVLASIRSRWANDPDEERLVAAEELRRLARGRLARLCGARRVVRPTPEGSNWAERRKNPT